jgi:3-hydroxyacyl-CoA dehydrogenase
MPIDEVKKVSVLGAGTMGSEIAMLCTYSGYEATAYDVSEEVLQLAPVRQKELLAVPVLMGIITESQQKEMKAAVDRIKMTTDPEETARDADLLIEAVPEKLELKREIHGRFDQLCPPHTIMTTNTSSLRVSDIEDAVRRGDKFAALHFHTGLGALVDIMRGPRTSQQTVDILRRFVFSLGRVPHVMKKEKGGYLYNTILGAYLRAALSLVIHGYAEPEEVDRAYMLVSRSAFGPFGAMDVVGLNIVLDAGLGLIAAEDEASPQEIADFLQPYIERGALGIKTGKGFYTYPNPAFQQSDFLREE